MARIGGSAAVVGSVLGLVGNLVHPDTPGPSDPERTARVVAESATWIPLHVMLIVSFLLMLFGLLAVQESLTGAAAGALARLGMSAALVGSTVGVVILTADGIASKPLAQAWLSAPVELRAGALGSFRTEEAINFALLSPLNIVFAGFTFVLFGLATVVSRAYPRWLGWAAVAGGLGGAVSGVVQAASGASTGLTETLGIASPTVVTVWLAAMGVLLVSRARARSVPAPSPSPAPP